MRRPTVKCPACGTLLPNNEYRAGEPWICPSCSRQYRFAQRYDLLLWIIALVLSFAICFLFGLRGWKLAGGALVLLAPVDLTCIYLIGVLIQPPLEPFPVEGAGASGTREKKPKSDPKDRTGGLDLRL